MKKQTLTLSPEAEMNSNQNAVEPKKWNQRFNVNYLKSKSTKILASKFESRNCNFVDTWMMHAIWTQID